MLCQIRRTGFYFAISKALITVQTFHCTIRFINQISKEVLYETNINLTITGLNRWYHRKYCAMRTYRVSQKTSTLCFVRLNFIKYWPIFKFISLLESAEHL